jgi:hypothetical protein
MWISLWVDDVDAVYSTCTREGLEVTSPPEDKPWGVRETSAIPTVTSFGSARRASTSKESAGLRADGAQWMTGGSGFGGSGAQPSMRGWKTQRFSGRSCAS